MAKRIKKKSSSKTKKSKPEKQESSKPVTHVSKKSSNEMMWKTATIVLGVLLVLSIFTSGFRLGNGNDDSNNDANEVNSFWDNFKALFSGREKTQEAEITLEVYSDFECPYSQRAYSTIQALLDEYGDKIDFEYHHFPLSFHPNAQKAAEASECAREQGKFDEYYNVLFTTKQLDVDSLKKHAADLGLNVAQFNTCLDNGEMADVVTQDFQEGQQRGVRGTPTFFINDNPLVGAQPIENFEAIIDKLLAGEEIAQPEPEPEAEPQQEIVKSDRPNVELFVMSHCPYGTQMEKGILPVISVLKDDVDFDLNFVYYAMHGEDEVYEQRRQYCIQRDQKELLIPYLLCFLEAGDSAACLDETGIDLTQLESCEAEIDDEFQITENFEDQSSWLSGRFPLFNTDKDDNEKYGVRGSPTLVINGQQVSTSRDSASLLNVICEHFNEQPEACNTEFSSGSPSPGFGFGETDQANNAAAGCGV